MRDLIDAGCDIDGLLSKDVDDWKPGSPVTCQIPQPISLGVATHWLRQAWP